MSRRPSSKYHHSDHSGHQVDGRLNYAAAGRGAAGYTFAHAGRQLRLGPIAFWVVVGTLVIMAVWTITTATYFAFREDVLTRLIARQADMQFGYEDRIAELRAQVDRISSRQLLDQDQYEQKLDQILRRQAALESRASALNGLGDVKTAFELGGFVEYFPVDWFRTRVELRQGVVGHNGTVADFSADFIVPVIPRFTVSAGPRFTWESTQATSPYFSIDTVQAMASGLPIFNAKGGAHSYGAGAQVSYRINPQWEVHSYVEYQRLLGDAAASPLVTLRGSPNQTTIGMGASYAFDVKIR